MVTAALRAMVELQMAIPAPILSLACAAAIVGSVVTPLYIALLAASLTMETALRKVASPLQSPGHVESNGATKRALVVTSGLVAARVATAAALVLIALLQTAIPCSGSVISLAPALQHPRTCRCRRQ